MRTATNSWGETPTEIAEALSRALVYLRREADAVDGMDEVSALIQRACDAARDWAATSSQATAAEPGTGAAPRPHDPLNAGDQTQPAGAVRPETPVAGNAQLPKPVNRPPGL